MFTSESARTEALAFMAEHTLTVARMNARKDEDGRSTYDVVVVNPKGAVTFRGYRPSPLNDEDDQAETLGILIDYVYCLAESSDPDDAPYAQYAEVLEAMTGCDIEYLSSIFDLH